MNSNTKSWQLNDNDDHSQSSDEKMDTGSESFVSNTPTSASVLSSDSDERVSADNNVLRLNNPAEVLRLAEPTDDTKEQNVSEHNDSLVTKMENLNLNSPTAVTNGTSYLSISPPRLSSTLTLTTDHPLMGLFSPDGNYPDLIPKTSKNEEDKNLSLSSIEDERPNDTNGYNFFREKNNSKNNLYYSDNFVTADSQILDVEASPPDVARVVPEKKLERRRIIPKITPVKNSSTPDSNLDRSDSMDKDDSGVSNGVCDKLRLNIHSTPQSHFGALDIPNGTEEFHSGVAEWCESPSQLHSLPNFELPIELSTNITFNTTVNKELESPDLISSSTQEDKSTYQALLDPYTGSVALQHRPARTASGQRRKIQLPPEEQDDRSLDSVSAGSMESEAEPEPAALPSDDEDTKRSRSTVTISECSDLIPEYSAAEELRDERSWLTVPSPGGGVKCDMKVIEPYKRVVSHGGYDARGAAIIVFGACHLPDAARPDYRYVMDNLFLYVIWTLERLVTDEYVLVYLHGSAARRRLPSFRWLHECYKLIDRRLRKSLKHLYLVHPTFWLKSFVILTKPFVSSKFFRKLSYVRSLAELAQRVPVEPNAIPELVKRYDAERR